MRATTPILGQRPSVESFLRPEAIAQAGGRPRRICVLSDDLSGHPDEGVKKTTLALAAALARRHDVVTLSTTPPDPSTGARHVAAPRSLLSRHLRDELRRLEPEVLIYATYRSTTFFSFLRARLLRAYAPRARIVMFGLQTRSHRAWQRRAIRQVAPDLVCVQSDENRAYLARLGCRTLLLPSGVDTKTFRPVDDTEKRSLRAAYGFDLDQPVALHVGHLQEGRGIRVLSQLAATGRVQVALVASSSTPQEGALARELSAAGVRLFTSYLPEIQHLYQLADCYVFPVTTTDHAIEVPLSVLEALACDLPVVTTRFGGLPAVFGGTVHPGLTFVDSTEELIAATVRACDRPPRGVRELVLPYTWERIAVDLIEQALASSPCDAAPAWR